MIRVASADDAAVLARLINDAFVVESFFKIGDRTSEEEVVQLMRQGEFLLLEHPRATITGCVFVKSKEDRGYFGMLSVAPKHQGKGHGRRLIDAVEARCRDRGCTCIDIHIVNLREELPAFYSRLGYVETGTLPFSDTARASRPCHFIVMTKTLD